MRTWRASVALAVAVAAATALACAATASAASPSAPGPTLSPTPGVVVPRVTLGAPQSLWLGDTVSLTVAVDLPLPGAAVAVEALRAGQWTAEATATLDAGSRAVVSWRPPDYGPVHLRASLPEGAGHTAAVSAARRIIVNRPNRHRVPYRYGHYIVTVVHEYRLYYYERGALVRVFDVALGRPGYRTPLGTFRIYGKRKPARGALGACAMFYRRQGGIAIHGTDQPNLLKRFPRPFSHGCARMYDREVLWLYARVPKGTVVRNIR
jgi:lipoprotein-anchoring transpeptidase ErfK/SrfK